MSRGVNKDGLPYRSSFSTVPRCLKCFKTPYSVGSGCPVSRAIVTPYSVGSGCPVSRAIVTPYSVGSGCPVSRAIVGPFSPA